MKLLVLLSLLVLAVSGCSSNDDSDPNTDLTPDNPVNDSGQGSTPGTDTNAAVMTVDNHVAVLTNVFAIFSGKLYGDEVLTAPDFSVAPLDKFPDFDFATNQMISQPVDLVCSNGGTVFAIPESEGTDTALGWNFEFDNCQDGIALLDGQITNSIYEAIFITSEGFVRDDQTKIIRLSGSLGGRSAAAGVENSFWDTEDINFTLESGGNALIIEDATTGYRPYELTGLGGRVFFNVPGSSFSGEFRVKAEWTNNEEIKVRVIDDPEPGSDSGLLEITAGSENVILLDADTGDVSTISVTITADGTTSSLLQPWTLWSEDLIFISESEF